MNKISLFKILLAALALAVIVPACGSGKSADNETLAVIATRKSVRSFTSQAINEEDVMKIVKAGMAAPSARNLQPWELVVVTDRAVLDALAVQLPYAKMLAEAPLAIAVCGDTLVSPEMWVHDASAVSQNILLAVESLGLGAVWTAAYPNKDRVAAISNVLNLPSNVLPLNIIPIGYPNGEFQPKDKFKEEKIHYNGW